VPRLLVLNQYYRPGMEATAQLLTDLCEALAGDFDITVVCGATAGAERGVEQRNGVRVVRLHSTAFDRARMELRAVNYLTYLGLALVRGLIVPRPDLVFTQTDPPFIGLVGLGVARRFGVPFAVAVKDLMPENALEFGGLRSPVPAGAIRGALDSYLRRADGVIAIGETMRARLEARGVENVTVIPDWVDTAAIRPVPDGHSDRFVVMHSGNIGHSQDLDTLVAAARELPDVDFALVGQGSRLAELKRFASDLPNVSFRPFVAPDQLAESLSSASLHFLGLAAGLSGYVVPSRLYGILAAGRPVLVAADADSEPAQLVTQAECGIVVPPGRPLEVAAAIRAASAGEYDLDAMGERGRRFAVDFADRSKAHARYREFFSNLLRS
jgi:putative colanic acid biosynthesis glycosyltransferase WcaI